MTPTHSQSIFEPMLEYVKYAIGDSIPITGFVKLIHSSMDYNSVQCYDWKRKQWGSNDCGWLMEIYAQQLIVWIAQTWPMCGLGVKKLVYVYFTSTIGLHWFK